MAKITTIQTNFVSGRASERVLGRVDLQSYDQATKEFLNAYPFIHGGAHRRPGTVFIGEVRNFILNIFFGLQSHAAGIVDYRQALLVILEMFKSEIRNLGGYSRACGANTSNSIDSF